MYRAAVRPAVEPTSSSKGTVFPPSPSANTAIDLGRSLKPDLMIDDKTDTFRPSDVIFEVKKS